MGAHETNEAGSAAVVDLYARREGQPAPNVSVRLTRSGEWAIIEIRGEMDLQVVPMISDLLGDDPVRVVFELNGVTFMDAGGLGALVTSQAKSVLAGGCMRLAAPSSQARRLLMLTGADGLFHTFNSLDHALTTAVSGGPGLVS